MTVRAVQTMAKIREWPVVSGGIPLATSTIINSVLGLVFWLIAARLFSNSQFGVGATIISTMMMLADVACIGMRTGLVRAVPTLGRRRRRTVAWSYGIALAAAGASALTFLIGLGVWAPRLGVLTETAWAALGFLVAAACWSVFILEDAVLVGIKKPTWVPVENTIFGLAKIALLWPMSKISPDLGVFWAWALPVFPIVVGVNLLVARELSRQSKSDPQVATGAEVQGLRGLLRYSSTDWLSSLARLAATGIGPLLVLAKIDEDSAGYFGIAWLIAYTTILLSINVSDVMLAESSFDSGDLDRNSRQAAILSMGLTVPIVLVVLVIAPLLLFIVGGDTFADNASGLLRLLMLATIPNVVYQIYLVRLRSQGRMKTLIGLEFVLAVVVLGLGSVLLDRYGLNGIGMAWLVAFSGLGLFAALFESRWWMQPFHNSRDGSS